MPGTASSSSTERKRAVLRAVVDDLLGGDRADPGQVSSSSAVAELRLTAQAASGRRRRRRRAGGPRGTSTCIPSASGAARLTARVGRRGRAARTGDGVGDAAALRQPVQPGRRTAPATWTTTLARPRRLRRRRLERRATVEGSHGRAGARERFARDGEEREQRRGERRAPAAGDGQRGHAPTVPREPVTACVPTIVPMCDGRCGAARRPAASR